MNPVFSDAQGRFPDRTGRPASAMDRAVEERLLRDGALEAPYISLLYANLTVFVALILAANGMSFKASVGYVFVAFAVFVLTGSAAVIVNLKHPELRWARTAVFAVNVANDGALATAPAYLIMSDSPVASLVAAPAVVTMAFVLLVFPVRMFSAFAVGKAAILFSAAAYILVATDDNVVVISVLFPLCLVVFMIIVAGYWSYVRRKTQIEYEFRLSSLNESVQSKNQQLGKTIEAEKEARESLRLEHDIRQRLFSYIGHDLRQPISSIDYILYEMQQQPNDSAAAKSLADARQCIRSTNVMIEQALQISMLADPAIELRLEEIDVNEVFTALQYEFEDRAIDAGCELDIRPANIRMPADDEILKRILRNLMANAILHAPGSKITVECAERNDGRLFTVADTGPGIAESELETVFTETYRGRNAGARGRDGYGLGLAIALHLTQACNGKISVKSRLGSGSRFEVFIPARLIPERPSGTSPLPA